MSCSKRHKLTYLEAAQQVLEDTSALLTALECRLLAQRRHEAEQERVKIKCLIHDNSRRERKRMHEEHIKNLQQCGEVAKSDPKRDVDLHVVLDHIKQAVSEYRVADAEEEQESMYFQKQFEIRTLTTETNAKCITDLRFRLDQNSLLYDEAKAVVEREALKLTDST